MVHQFSTGLAAELEKKFSKLRRYVLRNTIRGFVFDNLTEEEAAEIASRPAVTGMEQDRVVSLEALERQAVIIQEPGNDFRSAVFDIAATPTNQQGLPTPVEIEQDDGGGVSTQDLPWGINRVNGGEPYTGDNVAWILDSGIDLDHPDLNVQVEGCFSAFTNFLEMTCNDRNGHGTQYVGVPVSLLHTTSGLMWMNDAIFSPSANVNVSFLSFS
jgi:hypothetical protein